MKTQRENVFRCEFCNKAMLSKGAMSLHERMCRQNPKNKHKCFMYCRFLNKDIDNDGIRSFNCGNHKSKFYDRDLHSYKLERNFYGQRRIEEEELVRMPLECDNFEMEKGHDAEFMKKCGVADKKKLPFPY